MMTMPSDPPMTTQDYIQYIPLDKLWVNIYLYKHDNDGDNHNIIIMIMVMIIMIMMFYFVTEKESQCQSLGPWLQMSPFKGENCYDNESSWLCLNSDHCNDLQFTWQQILKMIKKTTFITFINGNVTRSWSLFNDDDDDDDI